MHLPPDTKSARKALGLSVEQLAEALETDPLTIRRMEQSETTKTYRKPARRMKKLVQAYLAGFRPPDWPA